MAEVKDDRDAGRYTLATDHGPAYAAYARDGDVLVFTHTKVPDGEQGHGIGHELIAGALADVRSRGLKIVPQCPFVAAYIDDNPEARDLVA